MTISRGRTPVTFSVDLGVPGPPGPMGPPGPPGSTSEINVADFGAVGNGTTNDTAAIQAAIDAAFAQGGGVVNCVGGRWLIDSADLIVKQGVTLAGPYRGLGEANAINYATIGSAFIVNPLYTIRLNGDFSAVKGLGVFKKGLTVPTSLAEAGTLVASFSGKGITVGDGTSNKANDSYVGYCLILGFQYAYYNDFNERPRVEYVSGDCTNGIYMSRVFDMDHLSHCHFWPFLTAHQSWTLTGPAGYRRNGAGYKFENSVDWGRQIAALLMVTIAGSISPVAIIVFC